MREIPVVQDIQDVSPCFTNSCFPDLAKLLPHVRGTNHHM